MVGIAPFQCMPSQASVQCAGEGVLLIPGDARNQRFPRLNVAFMTGAIATALEAADSAMGTYPTDYLLDSLPRTERLQNLSAALARGIAHCGTTSETGQVYAPNRLVQSYRSHTDNWSANHQLTVADLGDQEQLLPGMAWVGKTVRATALARGQLYFALQGEGGRPAFSHDEFREQLERLGGQEAASGQAKRIPLEIAPNQPAAVPALEARREVQLAAGASRGVDLLPVQSLINMSVMNHGGAETAEATSFKQTWGANLCLAALQATLRDRRTGLGVVATLTDEDPNGYARPRYERVSPGVFRLSDKEGAATDLVEKLTVRPVMRVPTCGQGKQEEWRCIEPEDLPLPSYLTTCAEKISSLVFMVQKAITQPYTASHPAEFLIS